jgi:phage/plasmid primase-like uncharacterized protein
MEEKGFYLNENLIVDEAIHRFSKDGERSKKDEWYIAYEGVSSKGIHYLTCPFGSWKTDEKYIFRSWDNNNMLCEEERREFLEVSKRRKEETEKKLKEIHDAVAEKAQDIWEYALRRAPSKEYKAYLEAKNIEHVDWRLSYGLSPQGFPATIVAFFNMKGKVRTLQYISYDQKNKKFYKTFLAQGEKKGNYALICKYIPEDATIYVCEGYATGVSVYMSLTTDRHEVPVFVAGDAGNLSPVIKNLRKRFKNNRFIIAADNDTVGASKANEAAQKYNCEVVIPKFPKDLQIGRDGKRHTDFNDLHKVCGLEEVASQLSEVGKDITASCNIRDNKLKCFDIFNFDDYPPMLSEYIRSICLETDANPIMVLCAVVSMISAFMGKRVFIDEYFQVLYPNIWFLIIAKSGQFKSTALNKGVRIAIRQASEVYKKIRELKKDLDSVEEQAKKNDIKERILEFFSCNPLFPAKITPEGLLECLSEGRSGLIVSNEFSGWLQNLEKKYNNDLKSIFTDFYDVPPISEYKTRTQGHMIIESPFVSICGVSPIVGIKKHLNLNDVAIGFFARFLIIIPPYSESIPPALPNEDVYHDTETEEKLANILLPLVQWGDNAIKYKLSMETKRRFEEMHLYIYKVKEKYDERCVEILGPFIKRWSPYVLKLSMIMQYMLDPSYREITVPALESAFKVVCIAIDSTGDLYEGELGETDIQRKCRILLDFIKKKHKEKNTPVLRKDILSSKKLDGGKNDYDYILETLEDQGRVGVDNNGKSKTNWEYVPKD